MAINIGANFAYQGKQPNFARDSFATKAAMKAFAETSIDEGHLSYCAEDGNMYQFKSSNTLDDITGRWRVFNSDNQGAVYMGVAAPTATGTAELKPTYKCYYLINSAGNYSQFGSNFTESEVATYINMGLQITAYWDGNSWTLGDAGLASSAIHTIVGELSKYVPLENTDTTTITASQVKIFSTESGKKTCIEGYGVDISSAMDDLTITLGTGHKATINDKEIATTDLITALANRVSALETALTSLQSTVNAQPKQVVLTQAAYDALTTKDSNTIYYING